MKTLRRRITSVFLAVLILSSMVLGNGLAVSAATGVITAWEFADEDSLNANINTETGTIGATSGSGILSTTASVTGFQSGCIRANEWDVGKYWQMIFSTVGYSNIKLKAVGRGSNTGPKTFDVLYSTDGENWVQFAGYDVTSTAASINFASYADGALSTETSEVLNLPAAVENQEKVYIRFRVNENSLAINGSAMNTSTGVSNLNNVVIFQDGELDPPADNYCAAVTASVEPGKVDVGTAVTLSTATEGASIYYSVNGSEEVLYSGEIVLSELPATIVAYASKEGYLDSEKATFAYTAKDSETEPTVTRPTEPDVVDPFPDVDGIPEGAISIKTALESVGQTATVVGQVAAAYSANGVNGRNYILQDITDGKVYAIEIFDSANKDKYIVGDKIAVTGLIFNYESGGYIEIKDVTSVEKIGESDTLFPALTATIAQLNTYASEYVCRYVSIKDVTVSNYSTSSVTLTDATGSITIFKPAALPDGIVDGSKLKEVKGVLSMYRGTAQLRNNSTDDYVVDSDAELQCADVTATPASGSKLNINDTITLSTATADAVIKYSFDGNNFSDYTAPITVTELPLTITAYAVKDGYKNSNVSSFSYTKKEAPAPVDVEDPISDDMIPEGALNIKDAIALGDSGETATVVGQIVYRYGSTGSIDSTILEDVIDGEIIGYQLYDKTPDCEIGDIVAVTGTLASYGSVLQLKDITSTKVLAHKTAIEAQKVTVDELLGNPDSYTSEYVCLENMTLGEYGDRKSTYITDSNGQTIAIFKSAPYPENASAGTVAKKVYAAFSRYNTTLQLRNGTSDDFYCGQNVYESYKYTLASWAGTAAPETESVFADYISADDHKNESAVLTLSNGKVPANQTYIGSKGLGYNWTAENPGYYQFKVDATQIGKLTLSYKMRASNSAARDFDVYVSADGGNTFIKANTDMLTVSEASTYLPFSVALPGEASGVKDLIIRLQVASGTSVNGNTIGSSGSAYLQEITIAGYPIIKPESFPRIPAVSVKEGQVAYGTVVELTEYDGSTAYYSFDGYNFEKYDSTAKITLNTLPTTLFVYASKDGVNSLVRQIKYDEFKCSMVKSSPNGGAVRLDTTVKLTCDTQDVTIYYCTDFNEETKSGTWQVYDANERIKLSSLPVSITAYAAREGYANSEFKTFNFTERTNENYSIYFGQIHSHTKYSDGAGTCDEAFKYASSSAKNVDFLAVTDHSNSFDNDTSCSITDGSASSEWVEGNQLADQYTNSKFIGLFGYEMTWSNGLGHINTFNTNGFQSRNQTAYKTYATALQNYYNALKTVPDSISQFNHPGTTFGDFEDFGHYDADIDQLINMIEVGNGEGAIGSSGYFPSYEYYTRALDRGWHVAPTNNQDNHKGVWGDANTGRTVVLVDTFDRDAIYDAMRNCRIYATEDNDFEITYKLNDYIMGTTLEKDDVDENVTLTVDMYDPTDSAIGKVEVIVNGGLSIDSQTFTTNKATATFVVPSSYSYYYIRITQADGDIAVTAPVWVGKVEAVGISGISTTSPLAVQNEELDVNLDLYNNEDTALEIESIEFAIGDKVIHTADLEATGFTSLASYSTKTYTFNYTHDGLGNTQIKATVKAKLRGIDKLYTTVLKLDYVIPELVTKVIVDGTHLNDYVSGRYTGNMGNFAKIAANKNVKVDVVLDKITPEMLETCALLIISTPSKGMYDLTPMHFEDDFIKMVADYAKNGGTVIVCSMTDYYDTPGYINSIEENKLLEAIGTTIRVNSDTAVDDDNNGGQPYRLYLNKFNLDSPYLNGFVDGQVYSSYRGGTVDPGANGEALVYGHDTTYSTDWTTLDGVSNVVTDANGFDSSPIVVVEKGKTVFLATEGLEGGGRVFVSSGVFMSNFEVKAELDNIWDLPYANKTIIENIMDEVKVELPVTDIATVRKSNLNDVFHIQGYVTAGTSNENNKFFDAIYVQDDTAGITVFPYGELGLEIGTKMDITGYVDEYQGDREIQVMFAKALPDEPKHVYEPKLLTTKEAADYDTNGGLLTKVRGKVSDVVLLEGIVSQFKVTDESGVPATVFIDGYILSGTTGDNTIASFVKDGAYVEAVGLSYLHPEGSSDVSVPVLRVRNVDEIKLVSNPVETNVTVVVDGKEQSITVDQLKSFVPSKDGYTFKGWATSADSTECIDLDNFDFTDGVKLYAVFEKNGTPIEPIEVTVIIDGTESSMTVEQLKSYKPSKEGYTFKGWATSADSTECIDLNNFDFTDGVTLYAVFERNNSETEFRLAVIVDGKLQSMTIEQLKAFTPSKEGYTFKGWSTKADSNTVDVDLSKLTEDSGIYAVYAVWEKVTSDDNNNDDNKNNNNDNNDSNNSGKDNTPTTGDNSLMVVMYLVLMIGAAYVIFAARRRENN